MRRSKLFIILLVLGVSASLAMAQGRRDTGRRDVGRIRDLVTPEVIPPDNRLKRVVVASPRATLVTTVIPGDPGTPLGRPLTVGDATNFARDDDSMRLRLNRTIFVQLSPGAEGVWYDHAIGWLGAKVVLYARYWGDVEPEQPTTGQEPPAWRFVGRDGAAAITIGPAIGRAARPIGVPMTFVTPGRYELLARIITYAYPVTSDTDPITRPPTLDELRMYGVVAHDDVRLKVRVAPAGDVTEVDPVPHRELDLIDPMPVESLPGILE